MRGKLLFAGLGLALHPVARAVPSFARQLGVSWQTCHTAFPELTPYGRWFELYACTAADPQRPLLERHPIALTAQVPATTKRDATAADGTRLPRDGELYRLHMLLRHRYVATLCRQRVAGDADPLDNAAGDPVYGSRTGDPASESDTVELDFLPIEKVKLGAQFTSWTRFNGTSRDCDGYSLRASANDSQYLLLRLI
jgi:hypothetical protein